jgi:two-component system chemotaxis sensor kinase CheA
MPPSKKANKKIPLVLLIDDETPWIEAISVVLRGEPYTVLTAKSGDEALEKLHREQPDLILSDVRMPAMSGFDLYEKVREIPKMKSVPFVFMSSLDDYDARRVAKELGANAYIEKPFDSKEVKNVVHDLLSQFGVTL